MKKELPKAYAPDLYEDGIYKNWEASGVFNPDNLNLPPDAPSYSIVMPPPNVTGTLHLGHAAMLALEDILIRWHRMRGERALWLPGADHAAIATQTKVEKIIKEEGTNRHEMGREKFLKRVEEFARDSHDTIVNQIKKMGSSCDWSREAYTLDETRNKAVRSVFKMMYDDGLIYRGDRVVNWCPRCHSTLADDEVEYKTQKTILYTFKYSRDFPLAIASTRPETKLGDTAVAVNPEDERYRRYIGQTLNTEFCGVKLKIKVVGDNGVDPDFGTGALGVTPAHSLADYQMAMEKGLPIIKVINEDGKIMPSYGEYSDQDAIRARAMIVEHLKKEGLMIKEEEIENNLSLCYRCDTPIEPLPSLQWFIDVNKAIPRFGKSIKQLSIEAVRSGVFGRKKIKIVPARFEKNYFHWMDNLRDWCVSRQIWFGHRIPVWYKNNSKFKIQNSKFNEGEEIYVGIEAPEGDGWEQDRDTLDTWFSSGLWTFSTLADSPEQIEIKNGRLAIDSADFKNFHPTAVLETGYDILFFWVARMIIMTVYAVGDIPFQDVYLHGLVLDEKGKKMSKSKGNVIDPLAMISKYGTDAVRLSLVIGSAPGNDLKLNEEKIAGFRNLVNKLWNIARYIITNYKLRITNYELNTEGLTLTDKWIMGKMRRLIEEVDGDLNGYQFSLAGEKLRDFTWNDLADWYIEASKFEKGDSKDAILQAILKDLLGLWHPFIPFVTEAIWRELGEGQLIIRPWPKPDKYEALAGENGGADFELIKEIIIAVRNARSENRIEPVKKIKAVIFAKDKFDLISGQLELIKGMRTGIEEVEVKETGEKIENAIYASAEDIKIYLIGAVDKDKEEARIGKEIENLEKLIAGVKAKLGNQEFAEKAPAQIIAKENEKLGKYQVELENLRKK